MLKVILILKNPIVFIASALIASMTTNANQNENP